MPIKLIKTEQYDFIPESCRGDEHPATFKLKPLNARMRTEIADMVADVKPMKALYVACLNGVVGWENVEDDSGNEVPFNSKRPVNSIDLLGDEMIVEIGGELIKGEIEAITETDRKNSE